MSQQPSNQKQIPFDLTEEIKGCGGADADEKEVMDQQVAVRKSTVRSHCSGCGAAARHVAVNSKGQCFK